MCLDSLDDETLLVFIGKKARKQDVVWLDTMLDMGFFDFSKKDKASSPFDQEVQCSAAVARAEAVFEFLKETALHVSSLQIDPEYGALEYPASFIRLDASDAMKGFHDRLCDRLLAQSVLYKIDKEEGENNATAFYAMAYPIAHLFAKAVVQSCACDRTEWVTRLLVEQPSAIETGLHHRILGKTLDHQVHENHDVVTFTPRFYAMQFSSRTGMANIEAQADVSGPSKEKIYAIVQCGDDLGTLSEDWMGLKKSIGAVFTPVCHPSALGQALRSSSGKESFPAKDVAHFLSNVMGIDWRFNPKNSHLVAYEREGMFERFPTLSASLACQNWHPGVIERLKSPLDWDFLKQENTMKMSGDLSAAHPFVQEADEKARSDGAMAAFCARAIQDGRADAVLVQSLEPGEREGAPDRAMPLDHLIGRGYKKTLIQLLEAGLSIAKPPCPGAMTPLAMAQAHAAMPHPEFDRSIEDVFRSHSARSAMHRLLGDMGTQPFHAMPRL